MNVSPEFTPPDRAEAKIRPTILIFDSKPQHAQRRVSKVKKPTSAAPSFAFIQISQAEKVNEDERRIIKTHAMQHVLYRKQGLTGKLKSLSKHVAYESGPFEKSDAHGSTGLNGSIRSNPQAPPSNLLTFPIQTQPYMLRLLHNCM